MTVGDQKLVGFYFKFQVQGDSCDLTAVLGWLRFVEFPQLLSCYYGYLLPKQDCGNP